MMLSAGEHPMWETKQMGHKDWTMIAKIYGKWMPAADTDAGGARLRAYSRPSKSRRGKPSEAPNVGVPEIVSFFVPSSCQNNPNQAQINDTMIL